MMAQLIRVGSGRRKIRPVSWRGEPGSAGFCSHGGASLSSPAGLSLTPPPWNPQGGDDNCSRGQENLALGQPDPYLGGATQMAIFGELGVEPLFPRRNWVICSHGDVVSQSARFRYRSEP